MADNLSEIDGILHALGEMNAAWGHYEDAVFTLLAESVAGGPHVTLFHALRSELDMNRATAILKSLALLDSALPAREHILQLVAWTDRPLREHRNRLVHDPLYSSIITGRPGLERHYYRTRMKKEKAFAKPKATPLESHIVTRDIIKAFSRSIRGCEAYCGRILHYVWDEPTEPCPLSEVETARDEAARHIASYMELTRSLESR